MPAIPNAAFFSLPPDWVCEVLSPSTERIDRGRKLRIYAGAGVGHAWFVNPVERTLEVLRLRDGAWTIVAVCTGSDTFRVEPFDAIDRIEPSDRTDHSEDDDLFIGAIIAERRRHPEAVIDVSVDRFEELVAEALDGIPAELGRHMDNVVVQVVDEPRPDLFGLYEGIPLTERSNYGLGMVMPDRISIYRQSILARARTEADVVRQVRVTVIHEVAHHFGISDERLEELGWA